MELDVAARYLLKLLDSILKTDGLKQHFPALIGGQ
jgi:hypothetical protein